jgi:hypothetical protein
MRENVHPALPKRLKSSSQLLETRIYRDIINRVLRKQPLPEEDHTDVHEN